MKLTSRALRRLKLIYGNIAKTINPAQLYRVVSGRVQRWVITPEPIKIDLYEKPIFRIIRPTDKHEIKIFYDGHVEGLEHWGGHAVVNSYPDYFDGIRAQSLSCPMDNLSRSCPVGASLKKSQA